ncbi:small-conductance mechanosensitive channel [Clostridium sp. CAG:411]|jgi:small conductance mechanosensitive channel|nr:mechanosensitive ion channel [Lachnospiraceae bacterium]CDE43891.1 small-conductance mechanosensitive channel [Clostridium sp. CAG:411]
MNVKLAMTNWIVAFSDKQGMDLLPEDTPPAAEQISSVKDTVTWVQSMFNWIKKYAIDVILPLAIKIIIAIIIFQIGKFILKKLVKFLNRALEKNNVEEGTKRFLCSIANGGGQVILIFLVAYYLNFGIGAIVAMLGSAGLALGLALQGSLANFAGGILLLYTKPFRVGDYICALGNEGTVVNIDIVYTTLLMPDNRKVVLPNGNLANTNIVNITHDTMRRIDILVGVDYESDIRQVKEVLLELAHQYPLVLQDQSIDVFVNDFDSSAISMGMRVWVSTDDYWKAKWDLQEQIKLMFDKNHISIPYDRVDVKMLGKESN